MPSISENLPFKKNAVGIVLFVACVFGATLVVSKVREVAAGMKKSN